MNITNTLKRIPSTLKVAALGALTIAGAARTNAQSTEETVGGTPYKVIPSADGVIPDLLLQAAGTNAVNVFFPKDTITQQSSLLFYLVKPNGNLEVVGEKTYQDLIQTPVAGQLTISTVTTAPGTFIGVTIDHRPVANEVQIVGLPATAADGQVKFVVVPSNKTQPSTERAPKELKLEISPNPDFSGDKRTFNVSVTIDPYSNLSQGSFTLLVGDAMDSAYRGQFFLRAIP